MNYKEKQRDFEERAKQVTLLFDSEAQWHNYGHKRRLHGTTARLGQRKKKLALWAAKQYNKRIRRDKKRQSIATTVGDQGSGN